MLRCQDLRLVFKEVRKFTEAMKIFQNVSDLESIFCSTTSITAVSICLIPQSLIICDMQARCWHCTLGIHVLQRHEKRWYKDNVSRGMPKQICEISKPFQEKMASYQLK